LDVIDEVASAFSPGAARAQVRRAAAALAQQRRAKRLDTRQPSEETTA
jgi:hypothetical protein